MANNQKTRKEIREGIATLKAHILEGLTLEEAQEVEGWSDLDADYFARKLIETEVAIVKDRPIEEVFVDYVLKQTALVKDLEAVKKNFGKSNQFNALVGAIKAQSDIHDKIIARGQEFELIHKAPTGMKFIGSIAVADLSVEEVNELMTRELGTLAALKASNFGDTITVTDSGVEVIKGGSTGQDAKVIDMTAEREARTLPVKTTKKMKTALPVKSGKRLKKKS